MLLSDFERQWLINSAWACLNYHQLQQARVLLDCVLESFPDDLPALKMSAVALLRCGEYPQVLKTLDQLMSQPLQTADRAAACLCRSRALYQMGKLAEAKASHSRYLEVLDELSG